MAKLKCVKHNRRVCTGASGFLHRNGDGSNCDSRLAKIGDKTMTLKGNIIDESKAS